MEAYEQLEAKVAEWSGMPHVVACASGTAALHLALEALQLPPASEVICPDLTMVACARAIAAAGLKPRFVDCDDRLQMDLEQTPQACNEQTSAVMLVHVYGRTCNRDDAE